MQNITFDNDHFSCKVTKYFIFLQIGAMLFVLVLIVLRLYSLALMISFITLLTFVGIVMWLYLRFQQIPAVKEKRNLLQRTFQLQKSISEEEITIRAAKQKRESLFQAEQKEFDNALLVLQQNYIQKGLSSSYIKDAAISGVGPKLKERLALSGIVTAAHVSGSRIAQIPGFGDAKRSAVIGWQSAVYGQLDRTKPVKLPDEQLRNIKQKHQAFQNQNDANQRKAENNCQKLTDDLHSLQPRLKQLAPVTFTAYLGKSVASKGYIAVLIAFVPVVAQIISGVSATTSAIIASIPTATATPTITYTPTNTFTPTITLTPTITDTPTITFTPTITNTPIPTFTPLPTRTPIPTNTLVPIVTVVPQNNNPGNSSENFPPGVTAICNDGTYSFSKHRRGTCSWHGGVKTWVNKPPN